MKLESICVYCGSSVGNDPGYAGAAERLGMVLARAGLRLIYGGGSVGLMGVMARAALRHGGEVNGIIPGFLKERELQLTDVTELTVTRDMHERKREMFERADAFVALPGGIGTLEEVVEMMTWVQLGQHEKPIVLVNYAGFWEPLVKLLDHMTDAGFLRVPREKASLYQVVGDVDEILPLLERVAAGLPEPTDEAATTRLM
jgi:uncharacterized protein (TIGR00730 family)